MASTMTKASTDMRSSIVAKKRPARGQALTLMALTMLLVTLMVLLTLGISTRIKEKMEVQQVADAAAYSSAVATSRAMNSMALLNRVHISNMVALAANQSLISWAGLYYGVVNQFDEGINDTKCISGAAQWCPAVCGVYQLLKTASNLEKARVDAIWDGLDKAAAFQSSSWQRGVMDEQETIKNSLINKFLSSGTDGLVQRIVNEASNGDPHNEWTPALSTSVFKPDASGGQGSVFRRTTSKEFAVEATHGSRGDEFVTSRKDGGLGGYLTGIYAVAFPSGLSDVEGEGWFGDEPSSGEGTYGTKYGFNPRSANARDEISASITYIIPPCVALRVNADAPAWVFSDDESISTNDEHEFSGGAGADSETAQKRHTMGECKSCPGIWVSFLDLDLDRVTNAEQFLYSQPKAIVGIRRDYGERARAEPWALKFDLQMTGEGSFDNTGTEAKGSSGSTSNISAQLGTATAVSYYHRPGNGGRRWKEPPNLFNPFWRATLVTPAVDTDSRPNSGSTSRLQNTLGALGSDGALGREAVDALYRAGFKGWQ